MKFLLPALFFFLGYTVLAQPEHFSYKIKSREESFTFPIFSSAANAQAAKKINLFLQLLKLDLLITKGTKDVFAEIKPLDAPAYMAARAEQTFAIKANDAKLLSIKFDEAACGATCYYWVKYYTFNAANGDILQLKSLFTPEGYTAFYEYVLKKRITLLNKAIQKLPANQQEGAKGILENYRNDELHEFYISGKTLVIDGDNNFTKGQKFLGIDSECKFSVSEFQNYLNEYGKVVFQINAGSVEKYRTDSLPQLFKGTVAGKQVLLVLENSSKNNFEGNYCYLAQGKAIHVEGTLVNKELILKENDNEGKEVALINATFIAGKINGTWTSKDGKRKFAIKLVQQ